MLFQMLKLYSRQPMKKTNRKLLLLSLIFQKNPPKYANSKVNKKMIYFDGLKLAVICVF